MILSNRSVPNGCIFFIETEKNNYLCNPKNKVFTMKKGIHPESYRNVVFKDMSNDFSFMSKSAANTKETITWEDGKEYPLIKLEISSMSHPFFTGKMNLVDTAGRVDKFRKRYEKFNK